MEQEPLQHITLLFYEPAMGQRVERREVGTLDGRWDTSGFLIQGIHLNGRLPRDSILTMLDTLGIRDRVLEELNKTQFRGVNYDNFYFNLNCDFGSDPESWPRGNRLIRDVESQEFSSNVFPPLKKPLSLSAVRYAPGTRPLITVVAGYGEATAQGQRQEPPREDENASLRRSMAEMQARMQALEGLNRSVTDELERAKKNHADELRKVKDALSLALQAKSGMFGSEKELRQRITQLLEKLTSEGESE